MNNKKYPNSKPENNDHSMEWEESKGNEIFGACAGEGGKSSFVPNVNSGYTFSQPLTSGHTFSQPNTSDHTFSLPSTSGCTFSQSSTAGHSFRQPSTFGCAGQKRKCSFASPLPGKISRDISKGEQEQEQKDHAVVTETNQYYNSEISSRSSTSSSLPLMMQVEHRGTSCQASSDNAASLLVNDGASFSRGGISTDFLHKIDAASDPTTFGRYRESILHILNEEGPHFYPADPLDEKEKHYFIERRSFFLSKEREFSDAFDIPERHREALRRHLRNHRMRDANWTDYFPPAIPLSCPICRLFAFFK